MSDDNRPGLFTALILSAGIAGFFILPLKWIQRLSPSASSLFTALGFTLLAVVQPFAHAWALGEVARCGGWNCPAEGLAGIFGALPTWGWWSIAAAAWGLIVLTHNPAVTDGNTPSQTR